MDCQQKHQELIEMLFAGTGKDLIEVMKARFMPKGEASVSSILDFCDEKGIEYGDYVHF